MIEKPIFPNYVNYLNDESGLIKGNASKIFFPENGKDIQMIVKLSNKEGYPITVSGGGTGIAGGRVPTEGWVVSTDYITKVNDANEIWLDHETKQEYGIIIEEKNNEAFITVPAGMPLRAIQNCVDEHGWFYPPDPTENSSFIGGNIATNASGARSFKYGATRLWVVQLMVVLPDGNMIILDRNDNYIGKSQFIELKLKNKILKIPRPTYTLPNTTKNVAGPIITDSSQPIDLFIGTDGIFGIIVEAKLRLIPKLKNNLNILTYCNNFNQAISIIEECQNRREKGKVDGTTYPMAVELLGERSTAIIRDKTNINPETKYIVIIEQDAMNDEDEDRALDFIFNLFEKYSVLDSSVAQTRKEIQMHKELRHHLPETINELVRQNGQSKLGTDYAVPINKFRDYLNYAIKLANEYEQNILNKENTQRYTYVFWAHAGDAHLHLNFLPKSDNETEMAKKVMIQLMQKARELNGTIAAEHGLGKKKFNNKPALYYQIGEKGLREIFIMKKIIDPNLILNRGNLIDITPYL